MGEPDDCFEDDDDYASGAAFECAAFWVNGQWYCPLAGTEECDWECTETGDDDE